METEPSFDFADLSGPVYDALGVDMTVSVLSIAARLAALRWCAMTG